MKYEAEVVRIVGFGFNGSMVLNRWSTAATQRTLRRLNALECRLASLAIQEHFIITEMQPMW
jgi:hypothetical protein